MSQKKLNQAHVLDRLVKDRAYTIAEAAEEMGLSERQVIRLKGEYIKTGIDALVHKNIGRPPAHAFSEEEKGEIIDLKKSKLFENANFKHFQEIIAREKYGIKISYSSLHGILTEAGIKSPKKRRPPKKHRRRKRKAREGVMLQLDASPFDWFCNGEMYSIHGAIDDATGKVVALYLCKNECLQGYFEIMRVVVFNNGIPVSVYADRHTIFASPNSGKLTIEDELKGIRVNDTQFGRAMKQLGVTLIKARTAQAKGRIERLWETLQSRLPIEFALKDIKTVDEANIFLAKYIDEYNEQFAIEPEETTVEYRHVSPGLNVENVLCVVEQRTFDNGGVFSFHNKSYKIIPDREDKILPHRGKVSVLVSPVFGIRVSFAGLVYEVVPYAKPKKVAATTSKPKKKTKYIPPDSHYYKYGHTLVKKIVFDESDYSILKMLERIFLCQMSDAV